MWTGRPLLQIEHNKNLELMLDRAKERGFTFKMAKSTFCQVRWFGRVFSVSSMWQTGVH